LPQQADPNAVLAINLKLAARSKSARHVSVGIPSANAPTLLAEWKLEPDTNQRLVYRHGTLTPVGGIPDVSGFAALAQAFTGDDAGRARTALLATLALLACALVLWR